jgi:hypothetical protein
LADVIAAHSATDGVGRGGHYWTGKRIHTCCEADLAPDTEALNRLIEGCYHTALRNSSPLGPSLERLRYEWLGRQLFHPRILHDFGYLVGKPDISATVEQLGAHVLRVCSRW